MKCMLFNMRYIFCDEKIFCFRHFGECFGCWMHIGWASRTFVWMNHIVNQRCFRKECILWSEIKPPHLLCGIHRTTFSLLEYRKHAENQLDSCSFAKFHIQMLIRFIAFSNEMPKSVLLLLLLLSFVFIMQFISKFKSSFPLEIKLFTPKEWKMVKSS